MRPTLKRKLEWLAAFSFLAVANGGLARANSVGELLTACSTEILQDVAASNGGIPNPEMAESRMGYWVDQISNIIQDDRSTLRRMLPRKGGAGTGDPVEACLARQILGIQSPPPATPPPTPEVDHLAAVIKYESTPHSPQFAVARRDAMEFCKKQLDDWEGFFPNLAPADLNLVIEGSFLEDGIVSQSVADLKTHSAQLSAKMTDASMTPNDIALRRVAVCLLDRRAAQLEGEAAKMGSRTAVTPLRSGTNSRGTTGNGS